MRLISNTSHYIGLLSDTLTAMPKAREESMCRHLLPILFVTFSLLSTTEGAHIPTTLALVQYTADRHFGDLKTNVENLSSYVKQAAANGAKLIVFPEGSIEGYQRGKDTWCIPELFATGKKKGLRCHDVRRVGERVPDGPISQVFIRMAKEYGLYLFFSLLEKTDQSRFARTLVVAGPDGYVGKYRKTNLWLNEKLVNAVTGNEPVIIHTPYGRFGLSICYDWENYDFWEYYRKERVDAVVFQTDWLDPSGPQGFKWLALKSQLDIFATDDSDTNGTGLFLRSGKVRRRSGLSDKAEDGVSYYQVRY